MICVESRCGNILSASDVEALVNPVNTKGVMGAGLAKQFAAKFPEIVEHYRKACYSGRLRIGNCLPCMLMTDKNPSCVINFPTKDDWRDPSQKEFINSGLKSLTDTLTSLHIKSVAIPPLGCGLGGLSWDEVRPLIVSAFTELQDVKVVLYEPE